MIPAVKYFLSLTYLKFIHRDLPAVQKWQDVFVDEDAQLSEVVVPDHQDPREAYIDHIFNGPARFQANVVHRALKVMRTIYSQHDSLRLIISVCMLKIGILFH